jgi:hypothetical protein
MLKQNPSAHAAQNIWAHIVAGESGGQWPEGSLLVAWTLRAWQLKRGMPAELAGPRWGWNGWHEPTNEAWNAVQAAWDQPLSAAPFGFMRQGLFCRFLGSAADARYWRWLGWLDQPNFTLFFGDSGYEMNCYF